MAAVQRPLGHRLASRHRQGARRVPRGARVPCRHGGRMTRLDALAQRLDSPLLVTNLTNVFYLTGFDSSNAALLVEPKGEATLYTDFRYAESANAVPGVNVE